MGLRMKTLTLSAFTEKSDIQRWGVDEKPIYRGGLPKKGLALTDLRERSARKREDGVFERG